jgi:hypothetical protein
MHASIRLYRGMRDFAEAARKVEAGLVPILKEVPGFRGYYAIACEDGVAIAVSLFDDAEGARLSNERGAAWGKANLAPSPTAARPSSWPAGSWSQPRPDGFPRRPGIRG